MPKKLSYRIDLYDLVLYNNSKSYLKYVATFLFRVINKLGLKGRYIYQYEIPFKDVDGLVDYIFTKHTHLIDDTNLLVTIFDEVKFGYYCLLSSIKTRRMLCDDMSDVQEAFDLLVNKQIKDISRDEVLLCKKFINSLTVEDVVDRYNQKYVNPEDDIELPLQDEEDTEDIVEKYITYEQIEIDLDKHRDKVATVSDITLYQIPEEAVQKAARRQSSIETKIIPKSIKENQLLCECGIYYTKSNYSHHKRNNKSHKEWLLNNGGKEA